MKGKITINGMSEDRSYILELEDDGTKDFEVMIRIGQNLVEQAIQRDYSRQDFDDLKNQCAENMQKCSKEEHGQYLEWQERLEELGTFDYLEEN